MKKVYICECGKIFENPQSFNGHKSHCKEHQIAKWGSLDQYNAVRRQQIESSQKTWENKAENKRQNELEQWILEKHTCEKCGKIMIEKYGSGRFCSSECAHSRSITDEIKLKISNSTKDTKRKHGVIILSDLPKKYCKLCGKELNPYNKSGYCKYCINKAPERYKARVEAGKKGYETKVKNGTHVPWMSRNIQTYPESFWQTVLNNNNIIYEGPNKPVKKSDNKYCYFLDFYIEKNNYKIDLEIDGKQHETDENKIHDAFRDEYSESIGYLVYRVKWNEINSDEGKIIMEQKITDFINWLNQL